MLKPVFIKENIRTLTVSKSEALFSQQICPGSYKIPEIPFPKEFPWDIHTELKWSHHYYNFCLWKNEAWLNFFRNFIQVYTGIWRNNYNFPSIFLSHEQSLSLRIIPDDRDYCGNIQITENQEWFPVLLITSEVSLIFFFPGLDKITDLSQHAQTNFYVLLSRFVLLINVFSLLRFLSKKLDKKGWIYSLGAIFIPVLYWRITNFKHRQLTLPVTLKTTIKRLVKLGFILD